MGQWLSTSPPRLGAEGESDTPGGTRGGHVAPDQAWWSARSARAAPEPCLETLADGESRSMGARKPQATHGSTATLRSARAEPLAQTTPSTRASASGDAFFDSRAIGSCERTITSVFRRRGDRILLGHAALVLGADGQRLELRHAGPDEDEVEGDDGHEDPVQYHLAVPARSRPSGLGVFGGAGTRAKNTE